MKDKKFKFLPQFDTILCLLVCFSSSIKVFSNTYEVKDSSMHPRVSVVTLGVENIEKSKKFYETLGFIASSTSNEHFVAFQAGGIVLSLFPKKMLADDAKAEAGKGTGFNGITLAYNVKDKEEVNKFLELAKKAGANITKNAEEAFWGGYSGYFADLDGHLWEVAWNPHWPLGDDGAVVLPP